MPATLNALALTLGRNCMEICVSLYLKHRHKFLSQELHSRGWNKNVSGQVSALLVCMCILNRIQTKGLDVKCAQIEKGKIKEQIFGRTSLINEMLLFCRCCFLFCFFLFKNAFCPSLTWVDDYTWSSSEALFTFLNLFEVRRVKPIISQLVRLKLMRVKQGWLSQFLLLREYLIYTS